MRAVRRTFTGPAGFLSEPANRARVGEYLADMVRPYAREVPQALLPGPALGHSYAEMAEALIGLAVPADEPVGLLILAFSIHDLRPGQQTAAYLSHVTPGAPMAFAVCDQGSAAAFSGLRIAHDYMSSAGVRRALLIVVEQAALPYESPAPVPAQHRGVAMLYGARAGWRGQSQQSEGWRGRSQQRAGWRGRSQPRVGWRGRSQPRVGWRGQSQPSAGWRGRSQQRAGPAARLSGVRQHPAVPPGSAAGLAAAGLAELAAGHRDVGLVLGDALAALWPEPAAGRVRVMPPAQPSTAVWWGLTGELASARHPGLVVAADYDPGLRYLCLAAFDTGSPAAGRDQP